jgi:copper chaperone CopZ
MHSGACLNLVTKSVKNVTGPNLVGIIFYTFAKTATANAKLKTNTAKEKIF